MNNLSQNPNNCLKRKFCYILEYLQAHGLPNIPNRNVTYQWPYFKFTIHNLWIQGYSFFASNHVSNKEHLQHPLAKIRLFTLVQPLIISSPTYTLLWGYIGINNFKILFYISIGKSHLQKKFLAISTGCIQ